MKIMAVMLPMLLLAACGSSRTPEDHEPLVDGRGAHAGSFHAPGNDDDAATSDAGNTQGNAQ